MSGNKTKQGNTWKATGRVACCGWTRIISCTICTKVSVGASANILSAGKIFALARARNTELLPPQISIPHNHEADELAVEVLRFKAELRRRSSTENTSLVRIFTDVELRYSREAVELTGGRNAMRSLMYRSRSKGTPQIPRDLTEYSATLEENRWRTRYAIELGPGQMAFFRRLIVAEDQSVAVIFASPTILHYVDQGMEVDMHMDATFKVVPRRGAGSQLFAIHIHYDGTVYPVVYALMERKTYAAYLGVLTVLQQLAPQLNVRSVMTDYEVGLREAVRTVLPGVRLLGCWFHFARAVHKRAASIGLVRRNVDDVTRRVVKMAMVLPLLPELLMAQGLQELRVMAGNMAELDPFLVYLEQRWLPAGISVYRQPQRTNNAVESFHRDLLRLVSREHPNIWVFTECLQRVEHMKAVDFQRSFYAVGRPRRPRYKYQRLNQRIHNAQNILDRDGDVRWFLLHLSHAVRGLENVFRAGLAHNDDADDIPRPPPNPQQAPPVLQLAPPSPQQAPPSPQQAPPSPQQAPPVPQSAPSGPQPTPLVPQLPTHHQHPQQPRFHPYSRTERPPSSNSPPPLIYFR